MPTEKGVSASSLLGLKAELHAVRQRTQRSSAPAVVPKKRLGDVLGSRKQRGARVHDTDEPHVSDLERSRAALERKASDYEAYLRREREPRTDDTSGGLIDWEMHEYHSENGNTGDQLVEYEDEFGRTRMVPRNQLPREESEDEGEYDNVIYGPATQFPVYTQADVRVERSPTPPVHFDADWEVRTRGAAFFKFSREESERRSQQEDLRALREETLAKRASHVPGAPSKSAVRRAARQALIDRRRAEIF